MGEGFLSLEEPWIFPITLIVSVLASMVLGYLLIPFLKRWKFGQRIRTDGPEDHRRKQGTPTMGGLAMLAAMLVATVFILPVQSEVGVLLGLGLGFGLLGFADDYLKVALRRPLGLRARTKLLIQVVLGLGLGWFAVEGLGRGTDILVPWTLQTIALGPFYVPFVALLVVSTTNAVNLTDGLDGLAAGASILAVIPFIWAALGQGQLAVSLFGVALMGVCIGFLWHNFVPAKLFMGDTGSLALGGMLAGLAVVTGWELLLLLAGGVFVIETLSVALQVAYFRITRGGRLFRMSPLHHHYELLGWSEVRVVLAMWSFQLLCVWLALDSVKGLSG